MESGQAARFRLDCPWGLSLAQANLIPDGAGGMRMNANIVFSPALLPGDCTVESQIDFGAGYVSFDAFVIRVV